MTCVSQFSSQMSLSFVSMTKDTPNGCFCNFNTFRDYGDYISYLKTKMIVYLINALQLRSECFGSIQV